MANVKMFYSKDGKKKSPVVKLVGTTYEEAEKELKKLFGKEDKPKRKRDTVTMLDQEKTIEGE